MHPENQGLVAKMHTHDNRAVQMALARFEGLYPDRIALSLDRISRLLDLLGRPQDRLAPVIHVAGTNGKGSTCAFLRAMAEAAGLRVHVFTSPHLVRLNERIRLAGRLIDDAALADCLTRTFHALGGHAITPFEAITATALLTFSETQADLVILEVGLGGRHDATNIVDRPLLSVITPIAFDHKQFLGNDLAAIAAEKAGIIKPGCPVVSAFQQPVCRDVIASQAAGLNAPLTTLTAGDVEKMPECLALPGRHQRCNATLAGLAMRTLADRATREKAIRTGLQTAQWPARMQKLAAGPLTTLAPGTGIWLDGGHNPHAACAISELLESMGGRTVLVSAMMANKDHAGFFRAFRHSAEAVHTLPNTPGHAGADPEILAQTARRFIPRTSAHACLETALKAAIRHKPDRILICGSLYLAGDVLAANNELPH